MGLLGEVGDLDSVEFVGHSWAIKDSGGLHAIQMEMDFRQSCCRSFFSDVEAGVRKGLLEYSVLCTGANDDFR